MKYDPNYAPFEGVKWNKEKYQPYLRAYLDDNLMEKYNQIDFSDREFFEKEGTALQGRIKKHRFFKKRKEMLVKIL